MYSKCKMFIPGTIGAAVLLKYNRGRRLRTSDDAESQFVGGHVFYSLRSGPADAHMANVMIIFLWSESLPGLRSATILLRGGALSLCNVQQMNCPTTQLRTCLYDKTNF